MPTIIRKNERSWAIDLISEINILLSALGLLIKKAGGESTISTGKLSMFPDVLLYGDVNQTQIIQGWELKLPDTIITDQTFIKDAERKARALGLNSFFIWNFTSGVLYVRNDHDAFLPLKTWNGTSHIKTRDDVITYKNDWLPIIRGIILKINEYLSTGELRTAELGEIISDKLMLPIIERNKAVLADHIRDNCVKNSAMQSKLNLWWTQVKTEYIADEPNMYSAYSKVMLLNWTNRLVFAHLIKRYHEAARHIEDIDYTTTSSEANNIINDITKASDFYNVFSAMDFSDILPETVWQDIVDFNLFLKSNGVEFIEHKSLQAILESAVNMSKREIRGQFTTPVTLAEFLARVTALDWTGHCADPCCGTGTIAKAILNQKIKKIGIQKAYETTWASDKYSFPLQVSNISLTSTDAINIPCRLFQENVFKLASGNVINIVNPQDGSQLNLKLPLFNAVASNLPFVPFEYIDCDDETYINRIKIETQQGADLALGGKGDIYSFITLSLWNMLEENGRLGIISSNSWLGTDWGYKFLELLPYYYNIQSIIISGVGRWFDNADVVTTILILQKKRISKPLFNSEVSFCILKKTLSELAQSQDIMDTAIDSVILSQEIDGEILNLKKYSLEQINRLSNLGISHNALFHNVEWLTIIDEKLIPITDIFDVTRGERRGQNNLFYPEANHGIEKDYIKPVLKNPKNLKSLMGETDIEAFCCSLSIEKLDEEKHSGAVRWIKKFESATNGTGKPLPEVLRKSNGYWYEMTDSAKADMVTILNPNVRLFVSRFNEPTFVDQRFTKLNRKNSNVNLELCHALLNSILGMFYIEAIGFGRGLGVLDTSSTNFKKIFMLNSNLLTTKQSDKIIDAFKPLLKRNVLSTEKELLSSDRQAFDILVLESYGILKHYDEIKNSLLSMQRTRLSVNR